MSSEDKKAAAGPVKPISESLIGILLNLCPNCFNGKVFCGLLKMNVNCPECQLHYEREPGYFLGAMSIAYSAGFVVILPVFLVLLFQDISLRYVIGVPALILVLISPATFRLSRLGWLHFDFRINQEEFKKESARNA